MEFVPNLQNYTGGQGVATDNAAETNNKIIPSVLSVSYHLAPEHFSSPESRDSQEKSAFNVKTPMLKIKAKLSGWESKMWSAGSANAARRLMTQYAQTVFTRNSFRSAQIA